MGLKILNRFQLSRHGLTNNLEVSQSWTAPYVHGNQRWVGIDRILSESEREAGTDDSKRHLGSRIFGSLSDCREHFPKETTAGIRVIDGHAVRDCKVPVRRCKRAAVIQ